MGFPETPSQSQKSIWPGTVPNQSFGFLTKTYNIFHGVSGNPVAKTYCLQNPIIFPS